MHRPVGNRSSRALVDAELARLYQKAKEVLAANREFLDKLADAIAEREYLISSDIQAIKATCEIVLAPGECGAVSRPAEEPDVESRCLGAPLTDREEELLFHIRTKGKLGVAELSELTGLAASSIGKDLKALEERGFIWVDSHRKRSLTSLGRKTLTMR